MSDRCCATCVHYRGAGNRCECPDLLVASRALRWPEDGQWCLEHEGGAR